MTDKELIEALKKKCKYYEDECERLSNDFSTYCNDNGIPLPPNYYYTEHIENRDELTNPEGITDEEILCRVYDKEQGIGVILLK